MMDIVESLRVCEPSVEWSVAAAEEIARLRGRVDRLERQREDLIKIVVDMSRQSQPPPTVNAEGAGCKPSVWEDCDIGSCHRHQACMYAPCRVAKGAADGE